MSQIFKTRQTGLFILHVQSQTLNLNYIVSQFTLSKTVGQLPVCTCQLSDFSSHSKIGLSQLPVELSALHTLVQTIQGSSQLLKCSLREYKQYSDQLWFTGCITGINNVLSTSNNINSSVTCNCSGMACRLMYNYVTDYTQIPGTCDKNAYDLSILGVTDSVGTLSAIWKTGRIALNIINTNTQSIQKPTQDTVLMLLQKVLQQVQAARNAYIKTKLGAFNPTQIKLHDYIHCDYKLSKYLTSVVKSVNNNYVTTLNNTFINGIQNTTVLDSLLYVLKSRLLTLIPQPRQDTSGKLRLKPQGVHKFEAGQQNLNIIKADRIYGVATASDAVTRLRVPDMLFVNMAAQSSFQTQGPKQQMPNKLCSVYGQFPAHGYKFPSKTNVRIRSVQSPSWLLSLSVAALNQGKTPEQQGAKPSRATQKAPEDTGKTAEKLASWRTSAQNLADAYAAQLYYSMFGNINNTQLYLTTTDANLNLDLFLGQSLLMQLPVDEMHLNGYQTELPQYYGVLQAVQYTYRSAKSMEENSYLTVQAVISGLTKKQSHLASVLFEADRDLVLYDKVPQKVQKE